MSSPCKAGALRKISCGTMVKRQAAASMWSGSIVPEFRELLPYFLPLVERVLIFLIDSRCIWYGCLAPKPNCLNNCRRSRDTQPSIKSDRAASHSSCIVYEMSHFHSQSNSRLVLDLMGASHFILVILPLHMLVQLLSSSLILLKWNWETQSGVGCFPQMKLLHLVS